VLLHVVGIVENAQEYKGKVVDKRELKGNDVKVLHANKVCCIIKAQA